MVVVFDTDIMDDYPNVCVWELIFMSVSGEHMVRYLKQLMETRGLTKTLVLDNGYEIISNAIFAGVMTKV
jgi:hypothetical protein